MPLMLSNLGNRAEVDRQGARTTVEAKVKLLSISTEKHRGQIRQKGLAQKTRPHLSSAKKNIDGVTQMVKSSQPLVKMK
jgi:hypothetical protein